MENFRQETLLQRRRTSVKINKEETMLILRAYQNHPTSWSDILEEVKSNLNLLTPAAREVYRTGTPKRLRDRMSSKLSNLIKQSAANIQDQDIRAAVEQIQAYERRLIPEGDHQQPQADNEPGPANPPQMAIDRDEIAGRILSSSSDEGQAARRVPIRGRRHRKRPLAEIIRENQLEYNRFIKKKIPKLMHMLGVSSSSEDSD